MRPDARLLAATEVLADILDRHRPAANALADWGKAHRFAGSGDRSAIGTLVYDVLRRRQSLAAQMGADDPRALVLAAAVRAFDMTPQALAVACGGSAHGLAPLTDGELAALERPLAADTPVHIAADVPEWLTPSLERAFGAQLVAEGEALARRAPVDLRTNTLKATREKVLKALASHGAVATPHSPLGVRIPAPKGAARAPNVEADAAHGKGWFEVQDEGSQIAALMTGAAARQQILDLCAGAGGKTLALAALMQNTGQIYAYDRDRGQLRPIFERLKRAGARNVQVMNGGDAAAQAALGARFDTVLIDAPCTGSGTWRRRPDAKWRLKPQNLAERLSDQRAVLRQGAHLVKPGGRLVYVTCSLLPEENGDQIADFLAESPGWQLLPWREVWDGAVRSPLPQSADAAPGHLLLTPARHGTDGFFIAVLTRQA